MSSKRQTDDEKISTRAQWHETPLKPLAGRPMTKEEIEHFRNVLVLSYKCDDSDIFWKLEKFVEEKATAKSAVGERREVNVNASSNASSNEAKEAFIKDALEEKDNEDFFLIVYKMWCVVKDRETGEDVISAENGLPLREPRTIFTKKIPIPEFIKKRAEALRAQMAASNAQTAQSNSAPTYVLPDTPKHPSPSSIKTPTIIRPKR